jgi:hypothetical protein
MKINTECLTSYIDFLIFLYDRKVPDVYKAHQSHVTFNIKYILVNNKRYSTYAIAQLLFNRITDEIYKKGVEQSILIQMKGRLTEKHDGASNSWKFNPVTSSCP